MSAPPIKKTKPSLRARKQASGTPTSDQILNGFKGPAPRIRTSFFYKIGMLVIAATMLLLPLIYLGLIGLVGYGLYYHAVEHFGLVADRSFAVTPRMYVICAFLYGSPFLAGAILLLFMVKPILVPRMQASDPLTLDASQEPLLFAFIAKLCETMGAPTPSRIDVDAQVNASAGYRRGLLSLFSRDLVLTIGLPFAAGMPLPQFVGVLAHEFGHFTQGSGMRLSYIVRRVNSWFERVVYERDILDVMLAESGRSEPLLIAVILMLTRLMVWLIRRILWCLMMLGHLISSAMTRQMEYDADRRAAAVIGSDTMAATLRQIMLLDDAFWTSMRDLQLSWEQQKLVDNMPVLIADAAARQSKRTTDRLMKDAAEERTRLFSTHPALRSRQKSLAAAGQKGVFHLDAPATVLFSNFKMIANAVTLTFYRRHIGLDVQNSNLIPVEQLVEDHDRIRKSKAALRGYFQECIESFEPPFLGVDRVKPPTNPKETLARLKAARSQFEKVAPRYRKLVEKIEKMRAVTLAASAGRLLIRADLKIDAKHFHLKQATVESAESTLRQTELAIRNEMAKLKPFYELLRIRVLSALQLARIPAIRGRLKPGLADDAEINRILAALETLEQCNPILARMMLTQCGLSCLISCDYGEPTHEAYPMVPSVEKSTAGRLYGTMQDVRSLLGDGMYPFERADGDITICEYVTPKAPDPRDPYSIAGTCEHLLDRSASLYVLCMARLVRLAEAVERVAGMPPLEAPPEPADND